MNKDLQSNLKEIKDKINSDKRLKTALYTMGGVICLYFLGKVFSSLATTVRGFNELKIGVQRQIADLN
jgi:hypothetical protein